MGMIIVFTLFALIAGAAMFNLPKGIELFIVLFPFLQPYLVFDLGGSHSPMPVILTAIIFIFIVFKALTNRQKSLEMRENFLRSPIMLFMILLLPTIIFNTDMIGKNIFYYSILFFQRLAPAFIGWMAFNSIEKGEKLIEKMLKVAFYLALYGVVEDLLKSNPIIDYLSSSRMSGIDSDSILTYTLDTFRGYRIQTIFYHAYAWGGYLLLLSSTYLFLVFNAKTANAFYKYGVIYLIIFFNIFFTRSRSCFLPTLVMIPALLMIMPKNKRKTTFTVVMFMAMILALAISPQLLDSFKNYFTAEDEGQVRGSSTQLRTTQLLSAFSMIKNNLFVGNGFGATKKLVHDTASATDLHGAESIWLVVLIDNGLIGVVAYILFYTNIIRRFIREKRKAISDTTVAKIKIAIVTVVCHIMFETLTGDMNTFPFLMLYAGIFGKYIYLTIKEEQQSLVEQEEEYEQLEAHPINTAVA